MSFLVRLAAALAFVMLGSCGSSADNEDELRRQFHIPDAIGIQKVLRTGRSLCNSFGPTITGEAKFDQAEFEKYKLSFTDALVWKPSPLRHFNDDPAVYVASSEALRWRPMAAGGPNVPGFAKAQIIDEAGAGDLLCYVIKVPKRNLVGIQKGQGYPNLSFKSCTARTHWETPKSFVVGHLDAETRTLHMKIKLINLPQYCERAHTDASTDLPF